MAGVVTSGAACSARVRLVPGLAVTVSRVEVPAAGARAQICGVQMWWPATSVLHADAVDALHASLISTRHCSTVIIKSQSNSAKAASNPPSFRCGGSGHLSNTMFLGPHEFSPKAGS